MAEAKKNPRHEVTMFNRKKLEISGVLNVESFDSEEFLLETECGFLCIKGQNLHMKNLSLETGQVSIEGYVHDFGYSNESQGGSKGKGLMGRLFK
ncbi:sporulation protein YabP [Ammoniphilus oxalaticus]|uniref:Sporulation protein YabP n=1 Tax=Ammoniphilus oxalaticus TaxID=66863 RepID=A0A419SG79_9BACL|nr:sporulation protein YabP [Ammoniphilus oxalaticus]RKD22789.1 sporulation protein YabP [Ammoniphilus oxalaticus]